VIAAIGIKRLGLAIGALLVGALVTLSTLSLLIPAETVRDSVKTDIRAATGLDPMLRGNVAVSLFPSGSVTFDDVALGDNRTGAPVLTAEKLVVGLRFFPLLLGHIEISDVSLLRPTIAINFTADGRSNWSSQVETLARALQAGPGRTVSFSEIRIADGTVLFGDERRNVDERLEKVEFALAWPSISNSFAATGRFVWHDQPIDTTLSLSDFVAALMGDRSSLKVRLAGQPFNLAFDGYISHRPTLKMEGTLAADTTSLRDTLHWASLQAPPGGGFGRFALKAQNNVAGANIALSSVNVELDGNSGEGVLTYAGDGRHMLQGTLAAEGLDLTPYTSTIRLLANGERNWERVPISLDGLNGFDVDLRLSAARVTVANARLGRTAIAANLRSGHLAVTIGESQAFGGVLKGSFGLARSQPGADIKAQLQFVDVDLDQALGEMFGIRKLEGKGNLGLTIDTSGGSIYDLTKALNGSASLTSRKGAIAGLNVEQMLKRLERSPLSGGNELRSGKTPYDLLAVSLKIAQGNAVIDDVRIEGPAVRLALGGSASIPARDLDLSGTASLLSTLPATATRAATSFELPFVVRGPWDDPMVLPDPQILIRRSPAAQKLLDAVENRNLRMTTPKSVDGLAGPATAPAPSLPGRPR
jgi:AsmA protein